jgi:hypothetical protein
VSDICITLIQRVSDNSDKCSKRGTDTPWPHKIFLIFFLYREIALQTKEKKTTQQRESKTRICGKAKPKHDTHLRFISFTRVSVVTHHRWPLPSPSPFVLVVVRRHRTHTPFIHFLLLLLCQIKSENQSSPFLFFIIFNCEFVIVNSYVL